MKENKKAKSKKLSATKEPKTDSALIRGAHGMVKWSFDKCDNGGPFAFSQCDFKDFKDIIYPFFIEYSKKLWADLPKETRGNSGHTKHHHIGVEDLTKEAQKRLSQINADEYADAIYSMSLPASQKHRIIGFKIENVFHVLWYDPNHEAVKTRRNKGGS